MPQSDFGQPIESIDVSQPINERLQQWSTPKVLKGLVKDWPVVKADNNGKLTDYLSQFASDKVFNVVVAGADVNGRLFYNQDMSGFNFGRRQGSIKDVLSQLNQLGQLESNLLESNQLDSNLLNSRKSPQPSIYLGSTSVEQCLPGFMAEQNHASDFTLDEVQPLVSAWLGNQTRIAAHFDAVDNIACVAAGKRRFTLFAPEQLENLYVGPSDFTPAGQAISLVDFAKPDFDRFPRFKIAQQNAYVAELAAGDALFIPAMWWHHVEALSPINLLINYWWRSTPRFMGEPMDAFRHALLSIKSLPQAQKQAWQHLFEHYVFDEQDAQLTHIPPEIQGELGQMDEINARRIRALLLQKLNR